MGDKTELGVDKSNISDKLHAKTFELLPFDNRRIRSLCGHFDEHLRQIERRMGVEINNRGNHFQVLGVDLAIVKKVKELLLQLYQETENNIELSPTTIHLALQSLTPPSKQSNESAMSNPELEEAVKLRHDSIKPRGKNQALYVRNILSHDINFGIGPAGTGKTYLAIACAVAYLEEERVSRILLVRPAVEAGEKLGFLPGDLVQKIDPYLRPLYDALYEMMGFARVNKLLERNVIEVAPLAYMRGRTLNDAFIILDEGQNTTTEQMKMFLTRIGFGSTAVITGDITQVDLPKGQRSGLRHIINILKNISGISFTFFQSTDVVRHALVQRIVEAYEKYENTDDAPKK